MRKAVEAHVALLTQHNGGIENISDLPLSIAKISAAASAHLRSPIVLLTAMSEWLSVYPINLFTHFK